MVWAIGIHGGAGRPSSDSPRERTVLDQALAWAEAKLSGGTHALDVVEGAIRILEDSGVFIAGKGAQPNSAGNWELDASICDGATRRTGAVAALAGAYPPISIARVVMERTSNVLLVGAGAQSFALEAGFSPIAEPAEFFTPVSLRASNQPTHGTVGATALDTSGKIAAGTSTGGLTGKRPGRVGDSAICGAGTWADALVGVSCTGQGEYFIRTAAAASVAGYYRHVEKSLSRALSDVLGKVADLGGEGGLIAVDCDGNVDFRFNSPCMRIGMADSKGTRRVDIVAR